MKLRENNYVFIDSQRENLGMRNHAVSGFCSVY
jgi:hypothetical protein